jgi:integrase
MGTVRIVVSDAPCVTITLSHTEQGKVLLEIDGLSRHNGGMSTTARVATPAEREASPVLARLESDATALESALDAWASYMLGRGRKHKSIRQFRETIEAAAAELGWRHPEAITFEAVTGWIGARVSSGRWALNTGDAALSAFKSFTRWLAAAERIERDPLVLAHQSGSDDAPGARAATTEEARLLIRFALAAQRRDRRATGNRALYWYALFVCGLRYGELGGDENGATPRGWKWGDLSLDTDPPVIRWKPDMHKGARHQTLPLPRRLAELLEEHRSTVPHGPDDPVFPIQPARTAWRADRERAGIAEKDARGRGFSPHSARKWCKTTLVAVGVQANVIDQLIRHANDVGDRYLDADLRLFSDALERLPELWPEEKSGGVNQKDLTPPPPIADDKGAKQVHEQAPPNHHADTAARTQRPVHASQPDQSSGVRAAASAWVESFDGLKSAEFALRQSALSDQKLGTEQRSAIADLLRSVARLLDGV